MTKPKKITDQMLRSWVRCKRKVWLDQHGDQTKRIWPAHKTLQLDHQHQSFLRLIHDNHGRGIEACKKGTSFIIGLRLKGKTPTGQSIETRPLLLQKVLGKSKWGQFSYIPVISRQGYKSTREHRLSLAFTALLLSKTQQNSVNNAIAISKRNKDLEIEKLHLSKSLKNELLEILIKLEKDINRPEAPPLTSNRRKCAMCCWKRLCDLEANKTGHLSEVSGIGAKRTKILQSLGINNLNDLAITNPKKLHNKFGELNNDVTQQIIGQALTQKNNQEKRLNPNQALPELNSAKGVLVYDIESDPDARHDFLHGFIPIKRNKNGKWDLEKSKYQPILNISSEKKDEVLIWKRLQRKLNHYKDWPILHYGETEFLSIYQLAKRQNASKEELRELCNRFIDIHSRVKKFWCLPLNNYGLKTIAKSIGFKWSMQEVDGPQALLWWRQWKRSRRATKGYSKNLKWIFNYNRDDCLATWRITDWLLLKKGN